MNKHLDRSLIFDSTFIYIAIESIKYILNKKIEQKQKFQEIEEIGKHLGERISNYLLNNITNNKIQEIDEVMKFLGRDAWIFLFGRQISKLQTNRKGTFLIDVEEIKLHYLSLSEKNPSAESLLNLEPNLIYINGIIKGILASFNFDCTVTASFKQAPIISSILGAPLQNQFSYSFTINLVNFN